MRILMGSMRNGTYGDKITHRGAGNFEVQELSFKLSVKVKYLFLLSAQCRDYGSG
jgi:hypothetical protein